MLDEIILFFIPFLNWKFLKFCFWGSIKPHLIRDICLLLGEFVVVSHFTIFPLELLGLAEKPMAGPSSSKGKIVKWDTFQIIGGKHNCLLLPVIHIHIPMKKPGMKMRGWKCGDESAGMKMREWKCGDESAGMKVRGWKMLGMKMRGWKCRDENAGMKMRGWKSWRWKIWGWKCGNENAGMKMREWKIWGWIIRGWKIWGWKNRGWKRGDETVGMKCHSAYLVRLRWLWQLRQKGAAGQTNQAKI